MAKQKSRAGRKKQKQKAKLAEVHGLPQAKAAALPARLLSQERDSSGMPRPHRASSAGDGSFTSAASLPRAQQGGLSNLSKVGLGVGAVLAVVFGLSQLRKGEEIPHVESSTREASSGELPSSDERSALSGAETQAALRAQADKKIPEVPEQKSVNEGSVTPPAGDAISPEGEAKVVEAPASTPPAATPSKIRLTGTTQGVSVNTRPRAKAAASRLPSMPAKTTIVSPQVPNKPVAAATVSPVAPTKPIAVAPAQAPVPVSKPATKAVPAAKPVPAPTTKAPVAPVPAPGAP